MSHARTDKEWDEFIKQAAREAVALYDEVLDDCFGMVMEALDSMSVNVAKIPKMEEDIAGLKSDMKIVKLAVKDTNQELKEMGDNW